MSTISKVEGPRGVRWRVRYRTARGASRSKTFGRRADADAWLESTDYKVIVGEYVDPSAGRVTFATYAERWLDLKRADNKKPTSIATWRSHLDRHLLPTFGESLLKDIDTEQVETWALGLSAQVAPTTARAVMATLRAVLAAAVHHGRIVRNPAGRVQVGAKTERRVDPLHIGQVAEVVPAIAAEMPDRWRAAVYVMASTGLRLGECLGLTVDRVDFLRRTIRIDRQMVTVKGSTSFGTPKTRAGVRTIPVPETITDMLAAHLAEFPAGDDGLLFTMPTGAPVARSRWADAWRRARVAVKLGEGVRTHDLRHVAASSLIASGLSVAAVQAVLGHASPAETLEVYTHLWPTDEDRTREAIAAASESWMRTASAS